MQSFWDLVKAWSRIQLEPGEAQVQIPSSRVFPSIEAIPGQGWKGRDFHKGIHTQPPSILCVLNLQEPTTFILGSSWSQVGLVACCTLPACFVGSVISWWHHKSEKDLTANDSPTRSSPKSGYRSVSASRGSVAGCFSQKSRCIEAPIPPLSKRKRQSLKSLNTSSRESRPTLSPFLTTTWLLEALQAIPGSPYDLDEKKEDHTSKAPEALFEDLDALKGAWTHRHHVGMEHWSRIVSFVSRFWVYLVRKSPQNVEKIVQFPGETLSRLWLSWFFRSQG